MTITKNGLLLAEGIKSYSKRQTNASRIHDVVAAASRNYAAALASEQDSPSYEASAALFEEATHQGNIKGFRNAAAHAAAHGCCSAQALLSRIEKGILASPIKKVPTEKYIGADYSDALDATVYATYIRNNLKKIKYGQPIYIIEYSRETRRKQVTELRLYKYDKDNFYCVRASGVRTTVRISDAYTEYRTAKDAVERERGNEPSDRQNT